MRHNLPTKTNWSIAEASHWSRQRPWIIGFNYTPRSAINQLEMWQDETFDPTTINQELGWASDIGFNMVRVFLHHLPWQENHHNFCKKIDVFLSIADRHNIEVMFVLFDDVWDPLPQSGKQPTPRAGVHNSGWVQSPGAEILGDINRHNELEDYVKGIISRYKSDQRVAIWDLYNEPGNLNTIPYGSLEVTNKRDFSLALLTKTFKWARQEKPEQPLTSGVWRLKKGYWKGSVKKGKDCALFECMLKNSDIITFHSYENAARTGKAIRYLKDLGRPMICTEYLARGHENTFDSILPIFAQNHIGAMNWGFVSGKTQTIYPWRSWVFIIRLWDRLWSKEPNPWHHDLLRPDGTAYSNNEIDSIRSQISKKQNSSVI